MQGKKGIRRFLAGVAVAAVTAATAFGSALPAWAAAGQPAPANTMAHLASGPNDGNDHFTRAEGKKPEAFVLSKDSVGDVAVGADVIPQGDQAKSRFRLVLKYVDDNNWAYLGCDTGNNWYIQYKNNGAEQWPSLGNGLPKPAKGQKLKISVSHDANSVSVTVNGKTAKLTGDHAAKTIDVMKKSGKVGMGAGTFSDNRTDFYFTNVKMGDKTVTDFSQWNQYKKTEGQTWNPAEAYETSGRTWIQITGGSHNGSGHEYGNPNVAAPALLLDQDKKTNDAQTLSMSLVPMTEDVNFGIFYTYVDNDNWMYVGYDGSTGWYCQFEDANQGSYPAFGGDLPKPKKGEELAISISVNREKVELTVNGKSASMSNQKVGDFVTKQKGKGHPGVKVNGQTSVKFADAKLADADMMGDTWGWAAEREGQKMDVTVVNLAQVHGTVKDNKNKPLSGATVRCGNKSAKTNAQGEWTMEDVEVGERSFAVLAAGFQPATKNFTVKPKAEQSKNAVDFTLSPKAYADVSKFKSISSDKMKVYVSDKFPQPVRYEIAAGANKGKFMRAQESELTTLKVNGVEVAPTVKAQISGDTASYELGIKPKDGMDVNATVKVQMKVEGTTLSWKVTEIKKNAGSGAIKSLDLSGMNLISLDMVDGGTGFAGAQMSTEALSSGDRYYTFDNFNAGGKPEGFMYGFLSNKDLSAGVYSNSEAEGDRRVTLNNGLDAMGVGSSAFYYEHGDTGAQKYLAANADVKSYPVSELPWVKVAISDGDVNGDKAIDWNDGACTLRPSLHVPMGSEDVKNLVGTRIVMNFGSEVTNPYMQTADNLKKFSLYTDGLPQALVLKGYGNEGHDSANSEYADISTKEGGVADFKELIKIAHKYNAQIGVHVNAQEAYPESKSFNERMVKGMGNGWGWLDQAVVIDKYWDLGSSARWNRLVQFYDRINGTTFANKDFAKGQYVGNPAESGAKAASLEELRADSANRPDNMDFIYLDVWYQDAWETRRIAEQFNALGWRFTTEFPNEGEYDSTWSHWATEVSYGGHSTKGINSDIVRFLRNDQRDTSPNNGPSTGGAMDNPLLGGWQEEGFEGWGNEQDFNAYMNMTFTENLPTRFLQHYQVVDWENYAEGASPVANHEKKITLKSADGKHTVVVERKAQQRSDTVCERTITLDGKKVLDDGAYLLPWEQDGQHKLYHYNVDGGSTTWDLPAEFQGGAVLYQLTDQGRVKVADVSGATVTVNAKAKTPYVIVKSDSKAKTADDVKFGEGTGVVDPGFNSYAEGDKLDAKTWKGDVASDAVAVKHNQFGDQQLAIANPAKDVDVSTTLSGLKKGASYVAEVYVANESDATATVKVTGAKKDSARSLNRSVSKNYTASDQRHGSYMTRVYVKFTADSDTATIHLARKAGQGTTTFDNIRVVKAEEFPVQAADGSFEQDFEHAVSGLYPFVVGPSSNGGDAVIHLSERHEPFSQTGWHNKQVDDAIEGNWSLKQHDGRSGLLYQTTPQTVKFEAGKKYTVEFDYQAGSTATKYQMVVGHGENGFTNPTTFLAPTLANGKQKTAHVKMTVTGAEDGQTWVGLYSGGNEGDNGIGSRDFVLDNFKVTPVKDVAPQKVDKAALQAKVDEVSGTKAEGYTADSFNAFSNALRAAQGVLANKDATQTDVDGALKALSDAYAGLVKTEPAPEPEPQPQPEPEPQPGPDQSQGDKPQNGQPQNGQPQTGKPEGDKPQAGKPQQQASKPSEGGLAQTGDSAPLPVMGVAAAGAVLLGAGFAAQRRRSAR